MSIESGNNDGDKKMKRIINKNHKGDLALAVLLNIVLFFMAVLPWLLYGEGFWEQSMIFNVLGVILGFSWFLLAVLFFYANIVMFIPKLNLHNIIHAINLVLFLALMIVLDGEQFIDIKTSVILIAINGMIMIGINTFQYLVYKKTDQKDYEVIKAYINNFKDDDLDQNKVAFLYHFFIIILFVLFFINVDVIYASAYYLSFIFIYFRYIHMQKKQMIIYLCISVLLITTVFLLIDYYDDFFKSYQIFETLLMSVPLLHLMPTIVKAYHKTILRQLVES